VKPSLTLYEKITTQKQSPLTVSDDQLATCGRWMGKCGVFIPLIPINRFHSHSHETSLAIPIPMGIPWDPWESHGTHGKFQ